VAAELGSAVPCVSCEGATTKKGFEDVEREKKPEAYFISSDEIHTDQKLLFPWRA